MASGDTRLQKHPAGIDPAALGEVERRVPADEAPPLAPNANLAWIGKPVPRIDGRAKVTGAARFTVDVKLPGMLHATPAAIASAACTPGVARPRRGAAASGCSRRAADQ